MKTVQYSILVSIFLFVGCGSNSNDSGARSTGSDNIQGESNSCMGYDKSKSGISFKSNRNVKLSSDGILSAYPAGSQVDLCNLLANEKVDVVSMQFSGVYCLTCQDQASAIAAFIASENLSTRVRHFVIFVDPADSQITDEEFENFIQAHSKTSKKGFDPEKSLMKKASSGSSELKFGTSLVFNAYGDVYGQDDGEGAALDTIKQNIKNLLPKK